MSYYDDHAEAIAVPNGRHKTVLALLSTFITEGMTVLDLGCGAGITTAGMRAMGADVVGVDACESLIDIARERYGGDFVVGDITDLCTDYSLGEYDALTFVDCIEHVDDFEGLFDTIAYRAKKTAWVYFNYPYPRYLDKVRSERPELLQPIDNSIEFPDLSHLMHGLGFEPLMVQTYGIDAPLQYVSALFYRGQ